MLRPDGHHVSHLAFAGPATDGLCIAMKNSYWEAQGYKPFEASWFRQKTAC
ncbi:hypothetical protein ACWDG1_41330 [Streptomyces sp. NPDC001177]